MPNWYRKLFICPLCGKRHGISLLERRKDSEIDKDGKRKIRVFHCKKCNGNLKTNLKSMISFNSFMKILWMIPITLQVLMIAKYDLYASVMRSYASGHPAIDMALPAVVWVSIWFILDISVSIMFIPMIPFEGQPDGQKRKRTRDRTVSQMLKNEPTYPDGIKGVWLRYKWLWLTLIWVAWMYILGMPFDTFKGIIKDLPFLLGRHWHG